VDRQRKTGTIKGTHNLNLSKKKRHSKTRQKVWDWGGEKVVGQPEKGGTALSEKKVSKKELAMGGINFIRPPREKKKKGKSNKRDES